METHRNCGCCEHDTTSAVPNYGKEAEALNADPPVKFTGMMCGYPMFQQEAPGVGSFMMHPAELTVAQAFARAQKRYEVTKQK